MKANLFVGTSGFAFDGWKGHFYPEKIKSKEMLPYYAKRLGTVEINYTFRHHPSEKTLADWRAATPAGFAFALKGHQRITHTGRLKNPQDALGFLERAQQLGDRLGPVLFQTPQNLKPDAGLYDAFLDALPPGGRYAFELRHPESRSLRHAITSRGAAFVLSETDEAPLDDEVLDAGRFAYLRLRREAYSHTQLESWARRIQAALAAGTDVYCYLKHEDLGLGPKLAATLLEMVEPEAL